MKWNLPSSSKTILGEERRLIVAPHLDDEVLGCGGVLNRNPNGSSVVFLCGRTYGHKPDGEATKDAIVYARKAKEVLGYEGIGFGNFRDEFLYENFVEVIEYLEESIEEFDPQLILVSHPGDVHQDHHTAYKAAMIACRGVAIACYFVPSGSEVSGRQEDVFDPNIVVPLTFDEVYAKQHAMTCYEDEIRKWPHRRSEKGIEVMAQYWGSHFGYEYGEPYRLIRA